MPIWVKLQRTRLWTTSHWELLSLQRQIGLGLAALAAVMGVMLGYRWWTSWPVRTALHQPGEYHPLAFSPDGAVLLTTGWQKDITVWDLTASRTRATWAQRPGCALYDGKFSPDGRTFVAAWVASVQPTPRCGLDLIDVATGRVRASVSNTYSFLSPLAFTGGRMIRVTVWHPGAVEIVDHDSASGRVLARRPLSCSDPNAGWSTLSSDGRILVLPLYAPNPRPGSSPITALVACDVDHDRELARLTARAGDPGIVTNAVSGDGRTIAVGRDDGSIVLWDFRIDRIRGTFQRHTPGFSVWHLAFAPDGRGLVSAGQFNSEPTIANLLTHLAIAVGARPRNEVILLDAATGRRLRHAESEYSPIFSPDGRSLATATEDGTFINVRDVPGRR